MLTSHLSIPLVQFLFVAEEEKKRKAVEAEAQRKAAQELAAREAYVADITIRAMTAADADGLALRAANRTTDRDKALQAESKRLEEESTRRRTAEEKRQLERERKRKVRFFTRVHIVPSAVCIL